MPTPLANFGTSYHLMQFIQEVQRSKSVSQISFRIATRDIEYEGTMFSIAYILFYANLAYRMQSR
jgi:hypothetical protein